ncbi:hypothetical protein [Alloactinosynnema sp. L-07]|nr:hypothetical protein [Alloactinosynnema sp. L-07]
MSELLDQVQRAAEQVWTHLNENDITPQEALARELRRRHGGSDG